MSFYTMAFLGMAPLGSLLTGWLSTAVGRPATLAYNGLACLAGAVLFAARLPALQGQVRPIYVRMNILPEIRAGIGTACELETVVKE
jgi:hypothetical protein